MPHACIGVDVITGFPGETDAHFMETYQLIKELPVAYLHVFTYSERPNTTAVRMDHSVPEAIRQERNKQLRILSQKKKRAFYASHEGTLAQVLWEAESDEGFMYGFTENYMKVRTPFDESMINRITPVVVGTWLRDDAATCELITEQAKVHA